MGHFCCCLDTDWLPCNIWVICTPMHACSAFRHHARMQLILCCLGHPSRHANSARAMQCRLSVRHSHLVAGLFMMLHLSCTCALQSCPQLLCVVYVGAPWYMQCSVRHTYNPQCMYTKHEYSSLELQSTRQWSNRECEGVAVWHGRQRLYLHRLLQWCLLLRDGIRSTQSLCSQGQQG